MSWPQRWGRPATAAEIRDQERKLAAHKAEMRARELARKRARVRRREAKEAQRAAELECDRTTPERLVSGMDEADRLMEEMGWSSRHCDTRRD